jgi:predicted transcriptional regulator
MSRFTIDIDDKFNGTLARLAHANATTKADVIRRAVQTYSFLKSEVPTEDASKRVAITDVDGKVEKMVILP